MFQDLGRINEEPISWENISNIPQSFFPSNHGNSHKFQGADYFEPLGSHTNYNFNDPSFSNKLDTGFYQIFYPSFNSASYGAPFNSDWVYLIVVRHSAPTQNYSWQTVANLRDTGNGAVPFQIWARLVYNGTNRAWERLLHRDSGRQEFTLGLGWEPYSASAYLPSYRKHGESIQLSGLIKRAASASATIATLPVGYRPFSRNLFTTQAVAEGSTNSVLSRIDIDSNGAMSIQTPTPSGALGWLSLNGISFFAA